MKGLPSLFSLLSLLHLPAVFLSGFNSAVATSARAPAACSSIDALAANIKRIRTRERARKVKEEEDAEAGVGKEWSKEKEEEEEEEGKDKDED
jgi:hypothetical protein